MDHAKSRKLSARRGNGLRIDARDVPPREGVADDAPSNPTLWIAAVAFVLIALGFATYLYR
jgi:hypothetical protein